jgi:putative redox protein
MPSSSDASTHRHVNPETGLISKIEIQVRLPAGFPDNYGSAMVNAVNLCALKKHLQQPPEFEVTTVVGEG